VNAAAAHRRTLLHSLGLAVACAGALVPVARMQAAPPR